MLRIDNLTKTYKNGKVAVDGLSLRVAPGDIFGFIGHNGAGKTTTIRSAAGILDFDSGEITVDGHSVRREPVLAKRAMAYIPDNPDIYDHLTGNQYLGFIADIYGVASGLRAERIARYGGMLELSGELGGLISSYSHGMKQKLVLISALLHEPKLLILDEPFVGFDPKAAFTLKELFREMCSEGRAVFFSTHVLETAEKLCNKIAIIKQGKLIACGDTSEVRGNGSLEDVFLGLTEDKG